MSTLLGESVRDLDVSYSGKHINSWCCASIEDGTPDLIELSFVPPSINNGLIIFATAVLTAEEAYSLAKMLFKFANFASYQAGVKCGFETAQEGK